MGLLLIILLVVWGPLWPAETKVSAKEPTILPRSKSEIRSGYGLQYEHWGFLYQKRKASTRLLSNQGRENGLSKSLAHYTIPKRSKTESQEEPGMVSVLCPLLTSAPQDPSTEVMPPLSPSEYLNKLLPTNQSPLAKHMAQKPLQQRVSSQEQFTAESMLIQDNYVSASGSPSTPDPFYPQRDPEGPMLCNKMDDPLGLKAMQDWDSSDFTFPPTLSLHTPIPTDLDSVQQDSSFHFQCFSPLS